MSEEITKIKHANVRLGTFILLIILVAIAFGGAGYLFGIKGNSTESTATKTATTSKTTTSSKTAVASASSTATTATADWKTHTNDTYGFSFKYPTDWEVRDVTSNNKHISNLLALYLGAPKTMVEDSMFNITITSEDINTKVSELKNLPTEDQNSSILLSDWVNIIGKRAFKLQSKNLSNGLTSSTYRFDLGENKILALNGQLEKDDYENAINYSNSKIADSNSAEVKQAQENMLSATITGYKILSTFQFTK